MASPPSLLALLLVAFALARLLHVAALTRAHMVTYGPASGDTALRRCDDCRSESISLSAPMALFNWTVASLEVSSNGILGLPSINSGYTNATSSGYPYIAPFYYDADTRPDNGGYVYYRMLSKVNNSVNLSSLAQDVRNLFPLDVEAQNFQPDGGFVLSYIDVGYFNSHTDLVNTFQVWLAWTSSARWPRTFCCFLYPEDGLRKTDNYKTVGYYAGNGVMDLLASRNVSDLPLQSNVNIPGKWCFKLSGYARMQPLL